MYVCMYVCVYVCVCVSCRDEGLFVYCSDFSEAAVKLVQVREREICNMCVHIRYYIGIHVSEILMQENSLYDEGRCHAFQCDITAPGHAPPFPHSSLHLIVLIFVLSAIQPPKYVCASVCVFVHRIHVCCVLCVGCKQL